MENIVDFKKKIRSVLLSSKNGVRKSIFINEYKQLTGENLNFRKCGYTTLEDFLRSIPDTVISNEQYYFAVSCDTTEHLEKLIQQQKSNRKLKSKENLSRQQIPGQHYIKKDKRRFNQTRQDRFSRYNADNRITRSVSMRDVRPELTVFPPPSSSTRPYRKHVSSQQCNRNHPLCTSVPATTNTSQAVDDLRTKLLSILYQVPGGLNTEDLRKEYKAETGMYIPLNEYGYKSVEELMRNFSVDNTTCIKKGPFFVAVAHDTINKSLQNKHYVSTPDLRNRSFISGNRRRITIHKRFNEFNHSGLENLSYHKFQMSEHDLSESRHGVNTDSQSKFPCSKCDCQCHLEKNLSMWHIDSFNNNRCLCCPNDNVGDSEDRPDREIKPRTVTLVDEQQPGRRLKIQHGNLALQELRISFLNTHIDDTNTGNVNK